LALILSHSADTDVRRGRAAGVNYAQKTGRTITAGQAADPHRRQSSVGAARVKALIDAEPDLIVCAEAANPRDGLGAIAESRPDLVIADLSLGPSDGLELLKAIRSRHAGLRVLVLTMDDMPRRVRRAFAAGADGHVSKQEMTETLLTAMRSVLRGEPYGAPPRGDGRGASRA
jgi:CheY-like chemotaxis protein